MNPPEIVFKVFDYLLDEIVSGEKTHEWRGWEKWNERLDGPGYIGPVTAVFLSVENPRRPPHKRAIEWWSVVRISKAPKIARDIYNEDSLIYDIKLGETVL